MEAETGDEFRETRIIRDIQAVPDLLNREGVLVTFEEPDGDLRTELMHPTDITALLEQIEAGYLSDAFEVMANTPKS